MCAELPPDPSAPPAQPGCQGKVSGRTDGGRAADRQSIAEVGGGGDPVPSGSSPVWSTGEATPGSRVGPLLSEAPGAGSWLGKGLEPKALGATDGAGLSALGLICILERAI